MYSVCVDIQSVCGCTEGVDAHCVLLYSVCCCTVCVAVQSVLMYIVCCCTACVDVYSDGESVVRSTAGRTSDKSCIFYTFGTTCALSCDL